jgi:hypothetical protein
MSMLHSNPRLHVDVHASYVFLFPCSVVDVSAQVAEVSEGNVRSADRMLGPIL